MAEQEIIATHDIEDVLVLSGDSPEIASSSEGSQPGVTSPTTSQTTSSLGKQYFGSPSEYVLIDGTNHLVRSSNFSTGSSGWCIYGDGSVEFNSGVFRGSISASTIDIGGNDATSFHVDVDGNMWLGASTYAAAPFKVSNAGVLTATGATIQSSASATAGLKLDSTSFRGYDSSGNQTVSMSSSSAFISAFGYSGSSQISTVVINPSTAAPSILITDSNTDMNGFQWSGPSAGTNSNTRTGIAAFVYDNRNTTRGDGFLAKNVDSSWNGNYFHVDPNSNKNNAAFLIDSSSLTNSRDSRITSEGFHAFPSYYHRSDFDETPATLAASILARAHWTGSGTSGTQIIRAAGADSFNYSVTYIRLSTTATASRSSIMTFSSYTTIHSISRLEMFVRHSTGITTTAKKWGWYYSATSYAYFYFDTAVHATKIYFSYYAGGTNVNVDLGFAMPTTGYFYQYTLQCYAGVMYVYVDGTLYATVSATVGDVLVPYFYVDNKATAVERTLDVDYVEINHFRRTDPL